MKGSLFGTLPIPGSDLAHSVDHLYYFLVAVSAFFFVLCIGAMVWFAFFYRKGAGHRTSEIREHHLLEIIWTVIPTILVLGIFVWGWVVYKEMVTPPSNSYEVRVIGKQWLWEFQYDHGKTTIAELYVPLNKPVKLVMTSQDVIHSFFIPNFRVKQDVVPGMYTSLWFEASVEGEHQVYCSEYCGTSHSGMLAKVIALNAEDWDLWLKGKPLVHYKPSAPVATGGSGGGDTLAAKGAQLAQAKGCVACHTADGKPLVGPSYKGRFGTTIEVADGTKVTVDENYIRESILNPGAKVVKGFQLVMPPFQGLLTEEEVGALVAYIKSLK